MATPKQHATTAHSTLRIHVSTDPTTTARGVAPSSQDNRSISSKSTPNQSTTNNTSYPPQPTTTQPPTNPSVSLLDALTTPTTSAANIKNVPPHIKILNPPSEPKDWNTMTLAEKLEATTDLPLKGSEEYEWKVESEVVGMSTWPIRKGGK